jgi:hypothetical protein
MPALCAGAASPGYRPRAASNHLKDIVEDSFDDLCRWWEERFAKEHGPLHRRVKDLFAAFTRCGDLTFGFVRLRCMNPDCPERTERLLPFS